MLNLLRLAVVAIAVVLTGCAHQIKITPDVSAFKSDGVTPIDKKVGYYISKEDREKKVITPGGGGDKVQYQPYKELEPALQKSLSIIFARVYSLESLQDPQIAGNGLTYVFVPIIATNSSSDSVLTWPPTKFTVVLACKAVDAQGATVWEKQFTGEGAAEFDEFKSDLSLSAKRAGEKAFAQFQQAVASDAQFRK
jgi:hypothetical protein